MGEFSPTSYSLTQNLPHLGRNGAAGLGKTRAANRCSVGDCRGYATEFCADCAGRFCGKHLAYCAKRERDLSGRLVSSQIAILCPLCEDMVVRHENDLQ